MTRKIHWHVQPAPTGRYRSFERRGWPTATIDSRDGRVAFSISCEDEYVPARSRAGDHGPLFIRVAVSNEQGSWDWRRYKKAFQTIEEVKKAAVKIVEDHPDWFE